MTEGKLKQEIKKFTVDVNDLTDGVEYYSKEWAWLENVTSTEKLEALLDLAKADFPKEPEFVFNELIKYVSFAQGWFEKWLGAKDE